MLLTVHPPRSQVCLVRVDDIAHAWSSHQNMSLQRTERNGQRVDTSGTAKPLTILLSNESSIGQTHMQTATHRMVGMLDLI
jgi:hypothetical protein